MKKLSSIFLPTIVGIIIYIVVSKLIYEKVSDINFEKDLKSRDIVRNDLIKKIMKRIMHDRALKASVITLFATAGLVHFHQEIEKLLVDDVFNEICDKEVKGQLQIVCDIVNKHKLNLHSKSVYFQINLN